MAEATATPICSPASPAIAPTQTQTVESTLQELAGLDQEVPYIIPRLAASPAYQSHAEYEFGTTSQPAARLAPFYQTEF